MSAARRFLVTGGLGCIGAWTLRALVERGDHAVCLDLATDHPRLAAILPSEARASIDFKVGDVSDAASVENVVDGEAITDIVHLAALQVPACQADPLLGARVNVLGTINVFETVAGRAGRIGSLVYASSMAVFSRDDGIIVDDDTPAHPRVHYGVFKRANEGNARVFRSARGVASVGLRPYVVYGRGRDQGMTSGPTKAMLAAALGEPYHIPYGGTTQMQYVEDVAATILAAGDADVEDALVFNHPGEIVHMSEIVAAIQRAAPDARVTFDDEPLPFPDGGRSGTIADHLALPATTRLDEGIARTIVRMRELADAGVLSAADLA